MKVEIPTAEPTKDIQSVVMQPDLHIEELEERITPGQDLNHNETFVRDAEQSSSGGSRIEPQPDVNVEELEERTAPGSNLNHNETLIQDDGEDPKAQFLGVQSDLNIEELEEKIAPGKNLNHNQTFVTDTIDVDRD